MRVAIDGRLKLGSELRRALEREELEIHYQPIVELETGELHALEALLRWRHPVDGLVTPGRFMPVAEETGLILPIGWWVLDSVCAQISTWVGRGLEAVPVHVNVASVQLSGGQLTRRVEGALLQHDCPGRLLHLELTESMVVNRKDEAAEVLRALKSSGVGLSIDDFGTGYSSLSYLHRFPADVLKVDRSFVSHLGRSGDDAKLVRTIVHLGHDLGMRVVAEGIEEGAQVARLKGMECDFGQGFFFSPALPPDEVASLLAGRTVGQAHEIAL
jgi:EAL domain-containing protein (putative c-di-GMP-specific phosphodiesterase class I)